MARALLLARSSAPAGRVELASRLRQLRPDRRSGPPAPDRGAGRRSSRPASLTRYREPPAERAAGGLAHLSPLSQGAGLARAARRRRARHPLSAWSRPRSRPSRPAAPWTRPRGHRAGDPRAPTSVLVPDRSGRRGCLAAPGVDRRPAAPAAALPRHRALPAGRAAARAHRAALARGSASIPTALAARGRHDAAGRQARAPTAARRGARSALRRLRVAAARGRRRPGARRRRSGSLRPARADAGRLRGRCCRKRRCPRSTPPATSTSGRRSARPTAWRMLEAQAARPAGRGRRARAACRRSSGTASPAC